MVVVAVNVLVDPFMADRRLALAAHVTGDLLRAVVFAQIILHGLLDFRREPFALSALETALVRQLIGLLMPIAAATAITIQFTADRAFAAIKQLSNFTLGEIGDNLMKGKFCCAPVERKRIFKPLTVQFIFLGLVEFQ